MYFVPAGTSGHRRGVGVYSLKKQKNYDAIPPYQWVDKDEWWIDWVPFITTRRAYYESRDGRLDDTVPNGSQAAFIFTFFENNSSRDTIWEVKFPTNVVEFIPDTQEK